MILKTLLPLIVMFIHSQSYALNIQDLWVAGDSAKSEAAFLQAKTNASTTEKLILDTQIARTYSMRRDFEKARQMLAQVAPHMQASNELWVRYELELGRTFCSGAHQQKLISVADRQRARELFLMSAKRAQLHRLDDLAVDALHMMAFVETDPKEQLVWTRQALDVARGSDQAPARRWEGSLLNNVGYALNELKDHEPALEAFKGSRAAYARDGRTAQVHIADWMIANTLRLQNKIDQALEAQHVLEQTLAAVGKKDRYVFEELSILYRLKGDLARANEYDVKAKAN